MVGSTFSQGRLWVSIFALAMLSVPLSAAIAQTYPTRPITVVVPFPAGGPTDTIGRVLGERMRAVLGQPIVIDNVSGANGSIGVGRAARAPADGYTLSIGQVATHVYNGATYALQYDLLKDLAPISLLTDSRPVFIVRTSLPITDLKGLIDWLKANPGKASAATAGVGSTAHLCSLLLQQATGTRFEIVPYRGGAPAVQSVVAGETDFQIADAVSALTQARAGKVKGLAVAGPVRLASAPDLPTVEEAGLKGLDMSFWHGLWAPSGTPKDIVAKLNSAVVEALADAAVKARLGDVGQTVFARDQQTPEALHALQIGEMDKWWPIIKAAGIKGE